MMPAREAALLLLRVDGSATIGTGHVMRCLALAQGWLRAGGRVVAAVAVTTPAIERRLLHEGIEMVHFGVTPGDDLDAVETIACARARGAAWIAADGYGFAEAWQKDVCAAGFKLLLFDDYVHAEHYAADLVLNPNAYATESLYAKRVTGARLLLGSRYVLLRTEFLKWRDWTRSTPEVVSTLLLTLGGSDPDNLTRRILRMLGENHSYRVIAVVGGSNPHLESIRSEFAGRSNIDLIVDAADMPELMAQADLAITGGGTTAWELAFMALPSLILCLADNQLAVAAEVQQNGIGIDLGGTTAFNHDRLETELLTLASDSGRRDEMSRRGRAMVDGFGTDRVIAEMTIPRLALVPATKADARILWEMANDPEVRARSFSNHPIPWADHERWLLAKLASPDCRLFVARDEDGATIGQVRFDVSGRSATISVSLARDARGRGYGSPLISRGCERLFAENPVELVTALIKPGNEASVASFRRAGFVAAGETAIEGAAALRMVLKRNRISAIPPIPSGGALIPGNLLESRSST